MITRRVLAWLTTICALVIVGGVRGDGPNGQIPGAVVRTTVSDSEHDYELRGATLSTNGGLIELIIAAQPRERRSESPSLVWATVEASGRILLNQDPLRTLSTADAASVNLRDPAAGSGFISIRGNSFLILPMVDGRIRLVRLTRSNEPAVGQVLKITGRSPSIRRVLAPGDERLLLVGAIRSHALVTEIDTEGKTIGECQLREEGMTAIQAVFELDGNMVVVCEQGMFPNTTGWIGRVTRRGDVLTQAAFAGRPTDVARGSDGSYLVLIEKGSADGSEILMKALAPDLSELWTRSLMSRQRPGTSFRVAPVASGGYVVAGTKDRGLWISRVKADGTQTWTEAHVPLNSPELELVSNVEIASTQNIFITAYTAFIVVGREQRLVVRTIRFTAN